MSEPIPIWKIIARSYCTRCHPDCTHCGQQARCITAAKATVNKLIDQYFVVPRVGDSLGTIAEINRQGNQDITDITPRPITPNPQPSDTITERKQPAVVSKETDMQRPTEGA